jgi:hypothetical protein
MKEGTSSLIGHGHTLHILLCEGHIDIFQRLLWLCVRETSQGLPHVHHWGG